ncbi:MAG: multiheme c-type cytochrome, partial [Fimbriimonadales bacterium]
MWTSSRTLSFTRKASLPLLAIAVFVVGCRSGPERLTIFVSGDSLGYLEPCGCRRDQAGGLPGRARLIEATPSEDRIVVDVGNMTSGTRDYEMLKFKYMLDGMSLIGYDAVNLGRNEAELDIDKLRSSLKGSSLPFVSANVIAKSDRKPVVDPFRIIERHGARIGVIGVAACDAQDVGPGVIVRPPLETLAEVIPKVKPNCDYLIVLAFVDGDTIREIADKFHEVDCIFGGDVPQTSGSVQVMNRASVFNVTGKGKVIGRLDLTRKGDAYTITGSEGVRIAADKVAPPKDIGGLLDRFKAELRDRRYEFAAAEGMEAIGSQSTANEFVGAQACKECHAAPHTTWLTSQHTQAFATLRTKKSEFDPDCLRCHTTGYALSSGFIDDARTPNLEGVQCESCHGRGKDHIATQKRAALKPVTPSTCIRCHDSENSENFRYASFWPK